MRRSIATLLSVVFVTAAGAATAAAQETVNFASVGGRVTDPQGAVIRGASVTARHTETNVTASTTSDDEGRFRFPYLRIGAYEITARHSGFADARRALTLTLGAAYELRLSLGLGEVTATLTVTAQATCSRPRAARWPAPSPRRKFRACRSRARGCRGRAARVEAIERHQHEASQASHTDGDARAQLSKLFFGRLSASNSARALAGRVCYCCQTAVETGSDGSIHAAGRHVYPGNIRDIAFTLSADGGRTFTAPVRVSEDRWVLDGCSENGPAIAVDAERRIHLVWPTLVPGTTPASEPTLGLFYATSRDGRTFTARQRIPTEGVPRHPQIAPGSRGDVVVVWDEQIRGSRRVALARGTMPSGGTVRFLRQAIGTGERGLSRRRDHGRRDRRRLDQRPGRSDSDPN